MKIGIVSNLYPPFSRGGAENVIVRTVAELLTAGHDVFVITGQPKRFGKGVQVDRSSTERIYRFFPSNLYFTLDDYKQPWPVRLLWHIIDAFSDSGPEAVRRIILDEEPDVIITHNLKGIGLGIARAIQSWKIPHVHVVHDLQLVIPSGLMMFGRERKSLFTELAYSTYRAVCMWRIGNPDAVIFPSRYLMDMYAKHGFFKRSKIVHLPNPAPNYRENKKIGRSPGPLKLFIAGQLAAHKGIVFLLETFAKIKIDLRLLIAGDGPLREVVEKAAKGDRRITYLGYTSPDDLPSVFSVVDATVVPSLCYENSPTVIYESLQSGVPVIAANIGGVGELIKETENGFLFTPGNGDEFTEAITEMDRLKDNFADHRSLIRASVTPYALPLYIDSLVAIIDETIESHRVR